MFFSVVSCLDSQANVVFTQLRIEVPEMLFRSHSWKTRTILFEIKYSCCWQVRSVTLPDTSKEPFGKMLLSCKQSLQNHFYFQMGGGKGVFISPLMAHKQLHILNNFTVFNHTRSAYIKLSKELQILNLWSITVMQISSFSYVNFSDLHYQTEWAYTFCKKCWNLWVTWNSTFIIFREIYWSSLGIAKAD